jgi:hypothetical protein
LHATIGRGLELRFNVLDALMQPLQGGVAAEYEFFEMGFC